MKLVFVAALLGCFTAEVTAPALHSTPLFSTSSTNQVHNKPPGSVRLGVGQVTDSTVQRTLRSSRTPPGTELEWTVRAAAGDVNVWLGLPTNVIIPADTLFLNVKNTSWDGDSTRFCAEVWNRKGTQRSNTAQALCWWEKKPTQPLPPAGPIEIDTVPQPPPGTDPNLLFFDDFRTGSLAPAQNGFAWGANNGGNPPDGPPTVVPFGSGFALRFIFGATVGTADDAFSEKRFTIANWESFFICMDWVYPANYFHRTEQPGSNNKGLRVWNAPGDHGAADMLVGFSTWGQDTASVNYGKSRIQIDMRGTTGTGPWGQGPNTLFGPGPIRIAYYVKSGTTGGYASNGSPVGQGGNGILKMWINGGNNGVPQYERSDLTITSASGDRGWSNGYIQGWWNAGPAQETIVYLTRIQVGREPIANCITPA